MLSIVQDFRKMKSDLSSIKSQLKGEHHSLELSQLHDNLEEDTKLSMLFYNESKALQRELRHQDSLKSKIRGK